MPKNLHNIYIQPQPSEAISYFITNYQSIAVLVDKNSLKHCYPLLKPFLPRHTVIEIPVGEQHKNLETCQLVWQKLIAHKFTRKSLLINLGGGTVTDLGGFVAATFKRGIHFIHIPTTLLGMCDAAIGGKQGIDLQGYKNMVGIFWNPEAIFIFTSFLKTLPQEEITSGWAEVVKHTLIQDSLAWEKLLSSKAIDYTYWVDHSVKTKIRIVEDDPREMMGLRAKLNFGHTIGHMLESFYLEVKKQPEKHGFCVAAGMMMASWISMKRGLIGREDYQQIATYLILTFPLLRYEEQDVDTIIEMVWQDKKIEQDKIKMVLLTCIGSATRPTVVGVEEVRNALLEYLRY